MLIALIAACAICGATGHLRKYDADAFALLCAWAAAKGYVPALEDDDVRYLWKIARKESSGRPTARNGQHYGLFQRAEKVHGRSTSCPAEQLGWYVKYATRRHGSPKRAYEHLVSRGWQ